MNLTQMDVQNLTQEPSARARSLLAAKLAMDYDSGQFSETEAKIAIDIFRILVRDVEKKVRRTLAEQLAHCPAAPKDVIVKLAQDEADIAVHVLEYSSVLTELDLVAIVRSTKEVLKLCAVARRANVTEPLSDALLDTGHERVLQEVFENKGAAISEQGLLKSWSVVSSNRSLLETLVQRGGLPLTVAEKLYASVTDVMKPRLAKQYKLGVPLAQKSTSDVREWEMLGIIPGDGKIDPDSDEQVEDLIDQLYLGGRLTHSFLIRALCVGSLSVFEAGLARLAGVPRVNARILLMDGGPLGFHAIYQSSGMPEGFFEAVRTLLKISLEETDFGRHKRADFRRRVIDRVQLEGYRQSVENMDYMLAIIGGKLAPASVH